MIPAALREQIRLRAGDRCEYCQFPQSCTTLPHEVDHVRSQKHRGPTRAENLCWACARCNGFKGSDIAGRDPESDDLVPLFNPRLDDWAEHFEWNGAALVGRTKVGRATSFCFKSTLRKELSTGGCLSAPGFLLAGHTSNDARRERS